jgi:hypothetical protein
MHYNLRESGQVGTDLHEALQAYSEQNQSRLLNDERRSATVETLYTRYDTGIFKRTRNPQRRALRQRLSLPLWTHTWPQCSGWRRELKVGKRFFSLVAGQK